MQKIRSLTVLSMFVSLQVLAGNCGFHNLVGEWEQSSQVFSVPDSGCGKAQVLDKTTLVLTNKGGKVFGRGQRVTTKSYEKKNQCPTKTVVVKYPYIELTSNSNLSIMTENGAQSILECNVNSDRSKLMLGKNIYLKIK